ncbi:PAS domain S-box protein [Ramlibacter sp. WS9]|nr:PAS domain S-box protein [Ramlibacter sp. WS9]
MLVLACAIPAVLAAILLIAYNFQREKAHALEQAHELAQSAVNAVDRDFASTQSALYALGTSDLLEKGDLAGFQQRASRVLQNLKAHDIVLTAPSGQQLVNTRVPFGSPLPVVGQPVRVKGLFDADRPVVTDLFYGKALKTHLFGIAVPVSDGTRVTHALAAGVMPETVAAMLRQQNLPRDWIAAVFDSSGTIVARSHQMDEFVGKKASPGLRERLQAETHGTLDTVTLEGVKVYTAFVRSPSSGWAVALGIPRRSLTNQLWLAVVVAIAVVGVLLATGFATAWHIGSRISGSIFELAKPAFALGYGAKVTVPPLYFHEANVLGETLSTASALLHDASAAVARHDARLTAIMDSAMDAIITVDDDQRVILYNRAAAAVFGWPPEEAVGRPLSQFIPARFRDAHVRHVEAFGQRNRARRGMGESGELLGLNRDGQEFPIEASISKINEDGKNFYTVVLRDITERVKARQALERSNADLRQFAYVASHDLKSPLRSIGGIAQILEHSYHGALDAKGIGLLRRLSAAAARLEQLTDDLLQLADLEGEVPAFAPVDCRDAVQEALQLMEQPIRDAGATVTVGDLPVVMGVHGELTHLFLNLIANAVKYHGQQAPEVRITAERAGAEWVISVADNGIGIDPKHHERIFEVFNRLHKVGDYGGTGIGLAICRTIAARQGGRIWVESQEGKGSTFKVALRGAAVPA